MVLRFQLYKKVFVFWVLIVAVKKCNLSYVYVKSGNRQLFNADEIDDNIFLSLFSLFLVH